MTTCLVRKTSVSRLVIAVLALSTVACGKDSTSPEVVARENLIVPITATTVRAAAGRSFTIPGAGEVLSPQLAGQNVTISFGSGAATTATIVAGTTTITANVSFGSCTFEVIQINVPLFPAGFRIFVPVCNFFFPIGGLNTGINQLPMTLQLGPFNGNPLNVPGSIGSNGQVTVQSSDGSNVPMGTVPTGRPTGSN